MSSPLPPDLLALAGAHRVRQQQLAMAATRESARLWGVLDAGDLAGSWRGVSPRLVQLVTAALLEATRGTQAYVSAAVRMWGAEPDPVGQVAESTFAATASDGRLLSTLLDQPALEAQALVDRGMDAGRAKLLGQRHLDRIVATQIADAARVSTGVAQVNDRRVRGWVRMVTSPCCSRCAVLAGKFYRVNRGFQRHPHCDCVHVPAAEVIRPQSPKALFDAMSPAELKKAGWSESDVRAINDGADIYQVTNARRDLRSVSVAGREVQTTLQGATRRGLAGRRLGGAPRLTPESIYAEADRLGWSRDETIRQLARNGYITGGRVTPRAVVAPPRPAPPVRVAPPAPPATEHAALDAVPAGLGRGGRGAPTLTRQHRDALRDYQSSLYYAINGQLRRDQVDAYMARRVERLDQVMAMSKLTGDVEVWRGVTDAGKLFGDALGRDMAGLEWRESAYVSTSAKRSEAGQFTYAGTPGAKVLMRIVAPKGLGAARLSGMDDQAEILLQRGTRMRVVADHGVSPEGYRRIDVAAVLP